MGNIRYKSGEAARMLGMSQEAIRYYEKQGIILSEKDEENGYRSFSYRNLIALQRLRLYNGLGFPVKESHDLINELTSEEISERLTDNEAGLILQIKRLERIVSYSKMMRHAIDEMPQMLNQFRIEDSPAVYHIKYQDDRTVLSDKKRAQTIKSWYEQSPVVLPNSVISIRELRPWVQLELGFSIFEEDYACFIRDHTPRDFIRFIPSKRSIYSILEVDYNTPNFYIPFLPLLHYIEENHLETEDLIFGFPLLTKCRLREDMPPKDYYQLWVPLKGS